MPDSRLIRNISRVLVFALAMGSVNGFAQQSTDNAPATTSASVPDKPAPQTADSGQRKALPDFSKPVRHFPNPIGPYLPHTNQSEPSFGNTPRIDQLIQNGKLVLSMDNAIALALENNLDIAIARYNLAIADTDILRSKAGSAIRGVASGLVQGTPGGGQGGFGTGASGASAGGTTAGAGGAGTGSSGIVSSTTGIGGPVPQYDPSINGTLEISHSVSPLTNNVSTGVYVLRNNTGLANFSYNQGFETGTNLSVGFNNNRQTTNSLFSTLNPALSSSFTAQLSQHLLQGFGIGNNLRLIHIAKNNKKISDQGFRDQIIQTVSQIQNIYWDLVNAYEDVRVKERSLGLANQTLSDNRKQVQIGTLAPIEIVRAESEASSRNQDLIISQTNLQLQETLMKNAISRNLSDPTLATIPVVPSDTMTTATTDTDLPVEELVRSALAQRPDYQESRIDLTNREINKKGARNALLPTVDAFAFYGASAIGGSQVGSITCGNPADVRPSNCVPAGTFNSGYGSAFSSLFDSSSPNKGAGVTVSIPIRNRAAQADQMRSVLEYQQAQLRLLQLENTIGIQVRNAQFALEQNRARVNAALAGRELAAQSLDAEQKKYSLGASTNILVLQAQRDLTQGEVNLVAATTAYEKSRVELDRVTGNTLRRLNIDMGDAISGNVNTLPVVPGLTKREDTTPTSQQQQQIQQNQTSPQGNQTQQQMQPDNTTPQTTNAPETNPK